MLMNHLVLSNNEMIKCLTILIKGSDEETFNASSPHFVKSLHCGQHYMNSYRNLYKNARPSDTYVKAKMTKFFSFAMGTVEI